MEQITYGNGVVTDYTYDANLRLQNILTQDSAQTVIQNLSYAYYDNGNVETITDSLTSEVKQFGYDELDRLKSAQGNYGPGQTFQTLSYGYDAHGNMTTKAGVTSYYNDANHVHAVTSYGADTLSYDNNGNMLTHNGGGISRSFVYDIENRLKQYTQNSVVTTYKYDEEGSRIRKTSGGITTDYVGELYEEDTTGTIRHHIFVNGDRVATVTDGTATFIHQDHLGSTSVKTNAAGLLADKADYRPYGEFNTHQQSSDEEGYYFTDQHHDTESELYYYNARYYNPELGRFLTADWIIQDP